MCWRQFMFPDGLEPEAWKYLAVVVPVVTIFGPVGALLSSYCHRQVLASFIYILDTIALVSTYYFVHTLVPTYCFVHTLVPTYCFVHTLVPTYFFVHTCLVCFKPMAPLCYLVTPYLGKLWYLKEKI